MARFQTGAQPQRQVRCAIDDREPRRDREVHVRWQSEDVGLGGHRFLRKAAMVEHRQDTIARSASADIGATGRDRARDLQARRERVRRLNLIGPGDHQSIGKVDAGCGNLDPHVIGSKIGPVDLGNDQILRATGGPTKNSANDQAPSPTTDQSAQEKMRDVDLDCQPNRRCLH